MFNSGGQRGLFRVSSSRPTKISLQEAEQGHRADLRLQVAHHVVSRAWERTRERESYREIERER